MTNIRLDKEDRFVIVASDGLWDFLGDQEAVSLVGECVRRNERDTAASLLVGAALRQAARECNMTEEQLLALPAGKHRRGRHDDTTVVVMYF